MAENAGKEKNGKEGEPAEKAGKQGNSKDRNEKREPGKGAQPQPAEKAGKEGQAAPPVPGQAPPQTPEMQQMQAQYNEMIKKVNLMVTKIAFYPVDISYRELRQIRSELVGIYKKGDVFTKNIIIVELNERMSHIEHAKEFISASKMAEKQNKQVDMREVTTRIYDSAHSMDGIMFLLGLLGELDDERANRLVVNHLTRYLNQGSHLYRTLIIYTTRTLAKSKSPFAIGFLLDLVETGSIPDYLFNDVTASIDEWEKRLPKAKDMDAAEKADLIARIGLLKDTSKQKGVKYYE
jgi:hypothetical protein